MAVDLSGGVTVQVTNKGNRPFSIQYNGRVYKLEPSKPNFVPAEAAILWFGDPRATDNASSFKNESGSVIVIPDRSSEVRRLCVKYGYVAGGEIDFLTKQGEFSDNNVPKVEVRTVGGEGDEDNEPLPTILSDPEGESVSPVTVTAADQADLMTLVRTQAQQILALQQHLGLQSTVELGEGQELPEDDSELRGEGNRNSPLDFESGPDSGPDLSKL